MASEPPVHIVLHPILYTMKLYRKNLIDILGDLHWVGMLPASYSSMHEIVLTAKIARCATDRQVVCTWRSRMIDSGTLTLKTVTVIKYIFEIFIPSSRSIILVRG